MEYNNYRDRIQKITECQFWYEIDKDRGKFERIPQRDPGLLTRTKLTLHFIFTSKMYSLWSEEVFLDKYEQ